MVHLDRPSSDWLGVLVSMLAEIPSLVVIFILEPDVAVHLEPPATICILNTVDVRANIGHFTLRIQLVGD